MEGFLGEDSYDRFDDDDPIVVTPSKETERIKRDPAATTADENDDDLIIGTTKAATSHVNGQGLWRSWQVCFMRIGFDRIRSIEYSCHRYPGYPQL